METPQAMPKSGDNLEQQTAGHLNELFAVEVAGFKWVKSYDGKCRFLKPDDVEFMNQGPADMSEPVAGDYLRLVPRICTDANAVLPWLQTRCALSRLEVAEVYPSVENRAPTCWHVTIVGISGGEMFWGRHHIVGTASTFPRAAVIALIRAKRAEFGSQL
jgi:hypothetical protein